MPKIADAVRMFGPEEWGTVDYFCKFYRTTYQFKPVEERAASGVSAHFRKAQYLVVLAQKLRPNLEIDIAELEKQGYSPVHNSAELATVIEAAILELYSTVDCTIKVIYAIHGKTTPGFKQSTRSFFQKIDNVQGTIPKNIRSAIKNAKWYFRLLHLRDELTHLMPGSCHLDSETKFVRYMHSGITEEGKPLIIDDVFGWLNETFLSVNEFIGVIFYSLNQAFTDKPVHQICGMVKGRMLYRYLRPAKSGEQITFDSGECGAWVWFDQPENPTCPFVDVCGAYRRKAPPQGYDI